MHVWGKHLHFFQLLLSWFAVWGCLTEHKCNFFECVPWELGSRITPMVAHLPGGTHFPGLEQSWLKWIRWAGSRGESRDLCISFAFQLCRPDCRINPSQRNSCGRQEGWGIGSARCVCTHSQNLALLLDEITDYKWLTHPAVQTFGLPGRLHSLEMTVPFIRGVFLLEEGLQQLTQLLAATCCSLCTSRLYSSFNSALESSTTCTKHFTGQRCKMWFLPWRIFFWF